MKAETGGDDAHDGNKRIVDSNLAYGITGEQFVVKPKTCGRNAYQESKDDETT